MRKLAVVLFMIVLMILVIAVPVGAQPSAGITVIPKGGITSPGTIRGFDPQPDPPSEFGITSPGTIRGFNPQPDPPHDPFRSIGQFGDGSV